MIFNSLQYLIFFSVVLLITILMRTRHIQIAFLVLASFIFYILSSGYLILCLIFVSLITYFCGLAIFRERNSVWGMFYLALATFLSLGQLGFIKYQATFLALLADILGPWIGPLNSSILFDASGLLLPIGISFYTFQSLSYVFDIYRGQLKPSSSLIEYIMFVGFFPQITSGPIVRARDFLNQLKLISRLDVSAPNLKYGITLIGMGLFKKMVLADNLAQFVDPIFSYPTHYNSLRIILATLTFGMQLYFDFSGYSDIAIGSARILGFRFPLNFNNPYLALSPSDFWHRWHMSLSSFLRDYLYIPLGGNRAGFLRTHLNLFITMIVCGLWHGSSWNFLLWGVYHGSLLSAQRLFFRDLSLSRRLQKITGMRFWIAPKVLITQYFIFLGWIMFRVSDWNDLIYCLDKFIFWDFLSRLQYQSLVYGFLRETAPFLLLGGLYFVLIIFYRDEFCREDWIGRLSSLNLVYWLIYLMAIIFALIWFSPGSGTNYIYSAF